jgi:hypothetical protein
MIRWATIWRYSIITRGFIIYMNISWVSRWVKSSIFSSFILFIVVNIFISYNIRSFRLSGCLNMKRYFSDIIMYFTIGPFNRWLYKYLRMLWLWLIIVMRRLWYFSLFMSMIIVVKIIVLGLIMIGT